VHALPPRLRMRAHAGQRSPGNEAALFAVAVAMGDDLARLGTASRDGGGDGGVLDDHAALRLGLAAIGADRSNASSLSAIKIYA
ncbi:hypothetical protein, partial [Streptococcus pseudopneumoniae]|uniref:hypothetical protein n=1 Tax=Streptococcus pseudopneumoniae TaxID=257758 RepID=UPI0018B07FE6